MTMQGTLHHEFMRQDHNAKTATCKAKPDLCCADDRRTGRHFAAAG